MKLKTGAIILLLTSFFLSCSSDLEDPDMVPNEDKLHVFTTKSTLNANGSDTTLVFCCVPSDAGPLDITLTTTKGVFLYSGTNTIKEVADSIVGKFRYASTVLRADTLPNVVYITAENGINRNRISILFN